jgi:hypothetical protein
LNQLQPHQIVKIKHDIQCEFAGFLGVIVSTRNDICAVKVQYHSTTKGTDVFIGVLPQTSVVPVPLEKCEERT